MSTDELYQWRHDAARLNNIIVDPLGYRTGLTVLFDLLDVVGARTVVSAAMYWDWHRRTIDGKYPDEWEKQLKIGVDKSREV